MLQEVEILFVIRWCSEGEQMNTGPSLLPLGSPCWQSQSREVKGVLNHQFSLFQVSQLEPQRQLKTALQHPHPGGYQPLCEVPQLQEGWGPL